MTLTEVRKFLNLIFHQFLDSPRLSKECTLRVSAAWFVALWEFSSEDVYRGYKLRVEGDPSIGVRAYSSRMPTVYDVKMKCQKTLRHWNYYSETGRKLADERNRMLEIYKSFCDLIYEEAWPEGRVIVQKIHSATVGAASSRLEGIISDCIRDAGTSCKNISRHDVSEFAAALGRYRDTTEENGRECLMALKKAEEEYDNIECEKIDRDFGLPIGTWKTRCKSMDVVDLPIRNLAW